MFIVARGIPWPPALNDSPASLNRLSPVQLSYVNVLFQGHHKKLFDPNRASVWGK